jgi:hypothetical protein
MWQRFSRKPTLYSRRRIFLLFGNRRVHQRVHGTPPLDSSYSSSHLNPVHIFIHTLFIAYAFYCHPTNPVVDLTVSFQARSQTPQQRLLALSCLSVRVYVRMEQLRSHWVDFHEIWYEYFRNSIEEIQASLKSYKNDGYFTRRLVFHLWIIASQNEECFRQEL